LDNVSRKTTIESEAHNTKSGENCQTIRALFLQ
jgi:hypothetical protein